MTGLTWPAPRLWWRWVAAVIAIAGLFVLEDLGADYLNELLLHLPGVDKVLHTVQSLVVFATIYWLGRAMFQSETLKLLVPGFLTISLAVFDEIQQQWAPGRNVDGGDVLASVAGIVIGVAILLGSRRPRTAAVLACGALALAGSVTYDSYARTRDYNAGLLLENQGKHAEARQHYLRALQNGFTNANLYNGLAWVEIESGGGDPVRAVAYAEQSLALRPGDADTLDTYGWALYKAGRFQDALVPLTQAFDKSPQIYCIHYHLGLVYLGMGRVEKGTNHLRRQIERAPGSAEALEAQKILTQLDGGATPAHQGG